MSQMKFQFWPNKMVARWKARGEILMNKTILIAVIVFGMVCSFGTSQAFGQAVYGGIFGTVTDQSGAAVANAKVTVTSATKAISVEATTNDSGNYSVTHLIPDTYNVRIEGAGFKGLENKNITVSADTSVKVDGKFEVGGTTETVEVMAEAPQLKTDRADVATIFNDKAVEDLPLFNRNFTALVLASPGAQQLGWSHASSENPQGSLQTKVNGQTFAGTGFMLDGTDNRDPILGIIVINPTLESVTEAKMTSQNYDAEFGQAIAGVVASQTKSGTNSLHGSGFGFRRSDATQARDPFSQGPRNANPVTGRTIPPSLYGQYGGAVGGPIIKDKLFFFGDYQATRSKIGSSFLQSIPSALVRSTCGDASSASCNLSEYPNQIYDPQTGVQDPASPLFGTGRTPFAGNLIPNDRISPQARALLNQFPAPNGPGLTANFAAGGNGIFNTDQFNVRIDDQTTSKLHSFGRYSFANYSLTGATAFGDLGGNGFGTGGFAGQSKSRDQSIAAGFDYAFRPSVLTDFRFGYVRYHVGVVPNGVGTTPASDVGIPGLNTGTDFTSGQPSYFVGSSGGDGTDIGAVTTSGGLSNFGFGLGVNRCNCPLTEQEDQFQFVNNWTKIAGNHQIKFGGDVRYARNLRVPSDRHRAGELTFARERTSLAGSANPTGEAMATFLLGDVTTFSRYVSSSLTAAERQKRFYFYGQDTWRATAKLTIAYGLRWDIMNPEYVNQNGNGGLLDLATGDIRVGGVGGIGRNFNVEKNWRNFAPRLGIAYQITPKTVVRMGYGRSYDIGVFGSIFGHAVTQNLPVLAVQNDNPNSQTDRVFTLATGPTALVLPDVPSDGLLPLPAGIFSRSRPSRMRLARLDAYNLTVQHQFTNTISADIAFVGNNGHGFYANNPDVNVNQPTVVGFGALNGPSKNQRRPYFSSFGWTQDISYFGNDAPSFYDALQAKVDKRFASGLQFVGHYTWSKNLSHDGGYANIDPQVNYGPDDFNRRHVFSLSAVYDLPFGKGRRFMGGASRALNLLIGGFQLNTTTNWSSGLPWSASYNECNSDQDVGVCRPILVGDFKSSAGDFNPGDALTNPTVRFFSPVGAMPLNGDTSGPFQRPELATFGSGRNAFIGPGFFNSDMSLFKNFAITERIGAQFRFEAFNVFNHMNLGQPNNCIDCTGSAGLITNLAANASMRQLNFGLKLNF